MVLDCAAQLLGDKLITCSHIEHAWQVVWSVYAVCIGLQFLLKSWWCFKDLGVVLDIEVGLELIFCSKSQAAPFEVHTQDGGNAPASLWAVDGDVGQTVLGSHGHEHTGIGGNCKRNLLELGGKRFVGSGVYMSHVAAAEVVDACSGISWEILIEFIRETKLTTKDVLLAAHIAVDIVLIGGNRTSQEWCEWGGALIKSCHHCHVKEGQTVVEGCLAATTHDAEESRDSPLGSLIGSIDRWDDGGRSCALIFLIISVVREESHSGGCHHCGVDVTGLECTLDIERQWPAVVVHKSNTCGVGEHGIDFIAGTASHHALECDVLIGVV